MANERPDFISEPEYVKLITAGFVDIVHKCEKPGLMQMDTEYRSAGPGSVWLCPVCKRQHTYAGGGMWSIDK